MNKIIPLKGYVQDYNWGLGPESIIHSKFNYESAKAKYAELWFGSHPNGPAKLEETDQNLIEFLGDNSLPFLLKVLSVKQALSIQAHPDENFAKVLHKQNPEVYRDPHSKPEVGIAISPVKLLCGFRSYEEIINLMPQELKNIVGDQTESIKTVYQAVAEAPQEIIKRESINLYQRLKSEEESEISKEVLKLEQYYPDGDLGIFSFYLLNLFEIPPGKGFFIGPNTPHAYLAGELVECMAPSDNVVRAGLTKKLIDLKTLLGMIEYESMLPELLDPIESDLKYYKEFPIPSNFFFKIGIFDENCQTIINSQNHPELIFCLDGTGEIKANNDRHNIQPGNCYLVPNDIAEYELELSKSKVFRVTVP